MPAAPGATLRALCPQPLLGTCCYGATAFQSSHCIVTKSNFCTGAGTTFSAATTACETSMCPRTCACDYNFDGYLNSYDVTLFVNDWLAGHGGILPGA